jgi:hypothetical protein
MQRSDRRTALWLALAVFAVLAPGAFFGVPGKSVAGAWRVLSGEVPYRDFWSMYAPGQFYATAAVLALCGKQVLAPALVACGVKAASAALLFLAGVGFGAPRRLALLVAAIVGLALFEVAPELSSYPPALACILGALCAVARPRPALVLAGLLLGAAAFFKHDVAAYATLAVGAGLALEPWIAGAAAEGRARALREALTVGVTAAGLVALLALGLAWLAGRDALVDLVLFPLGDFQLVRGEPYPGLVPNISALEGFFAKPCELARARDAVEALAEWTLANAPQLAFVGLLASLAHARHRLTRPARLGLAVLLASLPLYWWAAHTQMNTHLVSMAVAALLASAVAWPFLQSRALRSTLALVALFHVSGLLLRPALELALPLRGWTRIEALGLPHAAGIQVSAREREAYATIRAFTDERVAPDEPVYLGVSRHDAIVINNPRFLWLLDRPCATRYHELHPGVTDRDDVQREMIAELERRRVRCAVIWRFGWPQDMLDRIVARRRAVLPECGATALDEFLAQEFRTVLEVGEYLVLWRELER